MSLDLEKLRENEVECTTKEEISEKDRSPGSRRSIPRCKLYDNLSAGTNDCERPGLLAEVTFRVHCTKLRKYG